MKTLHCEDQANYIAALAAQCSDQTFGQDVIEWAIFTRQIELTYDFERDLVAIMGQPFQPETGRYDDLVEAYQLHNRIPQYEPAHC